MSRLEQCWWNGCWWVYLFYPVTLVFRFLVLLRRWLYSSGIKGNPSLPVPVIIVGNITVGGTGKTPFVHWLAEYLQGLGYKPGLVARGYGGQAVTWPQSVDQRSDPGQVGDEPVLLTAKTGLPMWVGPDRYAAAQALLLHSDCNVIISDDGMQHYALPRDMEILLIDGQRRFGNGMCLPSGPLREPVSRMVSVDFIVSNGKAKHGESPMTLVFDGIYRLDNPQIRSTLNEFEKVHAVAGIGNPERFFQFLQSHDLHVVKHAFNDHHAYIKDELNFDDDLPVLMTEKDAVKCRHLVDSENFWVVSVKAELPDSFCTELKQQLSEMKHG